MTNPDYTAVMLLIDRSGSMHKIRVSAEDAINEFIVGQSKAPGKRTIRITQFDTDHHSGGPVFDDTVAVSTDAADVPPFQLSPRGGTPLLDAIGYAINVFGKELESLPEHQRPGTAILAIMTDGHENSSREYTWPMVKELIERHEREFGWAVLYLAANQDAIEVGAKMGVPAHHTITYRASDAGTRSVVGAMTEYVAAAASGQPAGFTDKQRRDAAE